MGLTRTLLCFVYLFLAVVAAKQDTESLEEFQTWFETLGGKAYSVSLKSFGEMGVGLESHGGTFDGFKVLDIPLSLVIFNETIRANIDEDQADAFAGIKSNDDKVAAFLLLQLALGVESLWAPYIKVLPAFVPNAVSWPASSMPLPRGVPLAQVTEAQKHLQQSFSSLERDLLDLLSTVSKPELATLENWRWARSIVDSRAFRIHGNSHLVPFADFFNFAPHAATRNRSQGDHFLRYHRVEDESFAVFADRYAAAGTQLLEDYGDNDNEVYMAFHGFAPSDNQFACWQFPLPSSSALRRRGHRVLRTRVLEAVVGNPYFAQHELCLRQGHPIPSLVYRAMYVAYASAPQLAKCKDFARQPRNTSAAELCFGLSPPMATTRTVLKRVLNALNHTRSELEAFNTTSAERAELSRLRALAASLSPGDETAPLVSELWQKQLMHDFLLSKQRVILGLAAALREEVAAAGAAVEVPPASSSGTQTASRTARLDMKENKPQVNEEVPGDMQSTVSSTQVGEQPTAIVGGAAFAPAKELLPSVGVHDSTASPSEQLASTVHAFNAWMASLSPAVLKIEAAVVGDGMRLGVIASQDLQAEDVYLSLPPRAIMSAQSAKASALKETFEDLNRRFPRGDAYHELLFHLMYEAFVLGQNSTWAPYIATLPTSAEMGFPLFYTDRQLDQLQGMPIVQSVRTNRQQLRKQFNGISKAVFQKYPASFPPHAFNWQNYVWAAAILDSRSIWWSGQRHLVPLLDLINCRQGPKPARVHSTALDEAGENAVTKAAWAFPAGAQVWENYGQPNHIYFAYHGFTMQPNAHDCAELIISPAVLDAKAVSHNTSPAPAVHTPQLQSQSERLAALRWPESVEGCLAVPNDAVQPREATNTFGIAQSTVRYLVQALDTNEQGAMASLAQLAKAQLATYRTTLEEDESMLEQVLKTPTGDSTFIDVDEAIVRFRSGHKRLLLQWVAFAAEKLDAHDAQLV